MEHIRTIALALHILAGTVALCTGMFNIIARKGGQRHRSVGRVFAWAMYGVAATAVILSLVIESLFFLCIGIFAFYLTWNGQRSAIERRPVFSLTDVIILVLGGYNSLVMLIYGNVILIGFGILSSALVVQESVLLFRIRKGIALPAHTWVVRHVGMMGGSYIATFTAFLVVNVMQGPWPFWLPWALPTIVGVPLMSLATRKYTRRSNVKKDKNVQHA